MERYLTERTRRIIGIGRELSAIAKNGEVFPIYLAISEVQVGEVAGKRHHYFVGIIRDLTEQKQIEALVHRQRDHLARMDRVSLLGEMSASLAHEINQPLAAIATYAQAAQRFHARGPEGDAQLSQALAKLSEEALRVGHLVERIQQLATPGKSERAEVDIGAVLRETVSLAMADARMHEVALSFEAEDGLPHLYTDAIAVQQIVLNLVRNAIDAVQSVDAKRRSVWVSAMLRQQAVVVRVADDGKGVDPDVIPRIFDSVCNDKSRRHGYGAFDQQAFGGERGWQSPFAGWIRFACPRPRRVFRTVFTVG